MFANANHSPPLLKTRIFILLLPAGLLYASCAKIGTVSGGDKDTIPPVLVKSIPPNYSLHFNSKKIRATFDEFIDSKDLQSNFLVSPPLEKKPDVKIINKDLVVSPLENLQPNTTYTLNFGNSIVDYTVGNPIPNFEFVFSTGSYLDSLSIQGRLLDAFTLQPTKDPVLVMLYTNLNDSAPYKELPTSVCRTNKAGWFVLNNLKERKYRIFALKDANSNMKYDLPSELIAFADSVIDLHPTETKDYIADYDTTGRKEVSKSKLHVKNKPIPRPDTTARDSLKLMRHKKYGAYQNLYLFAEENLKQYMKEAKRTGHDRIRFVMSRELQKTDSIIIHPVNFSPKGEWLLNEMHMHRDTFEYWITDTALVRQDILKVALAYSITDSVFNYFAKIDTVDLRFTGKEAKKKKHEVAKAAKLDLTFNVGSGKLLDLNNNVSIEADKPLEKVDPAFISLFKMEDTLKIPVKFSLVRDPQSVRRVILKAKWEDNTAYKLRVLPPAFTSIYGTQPDTIDKPYKSQKADYYGKLIIKLDSVHENIVIQLLQKDVLVNQVSTRKNGKMTIDYINPGKYVVKIIYDKNGNGLWDTGNYLRRLQPEKIAFYPDLVEIRSNWDLEISVSGKDPY